MARLARDLLRCQRGATAIEYSLIAGAVALVIIGTVALVGDEVSALFQSLVGSV